jgi:hypothetical protein
MRPTGAMGGYFYEPGVKMNDELLEILTDLNALCEANSNAIEQVLMLGAVEMSQPEKNKRLRILASIQGIQEGCKKTLSSIEAARTAPASIGAAPNPCR